MFKMEEKRHFDRQLFRLFAAVSVQLVAVLSGKKCPRPSERLNKTYISRTEKAGFL